MSYMYHWPRYAVLLVFFVSGMLVHFRGRVRHRVTRQLFDHSTIMAPYNLLMYLFSAVPNRPFVDERGFPELAPLREQWQTIRDEALRLFDQGHIRAASKYNDMGFNSFFRSGWKRFYVKWYGDFLPSAQALCPQTAALLAKIPSVNAAMFALLPPGARLGAHRDPFAGSLRYHLGLVTPNSDRCHIVVDGEDYYWKDGEAVIFDETFIHRAENQTDTQRIILFCDIERPLSNAFARGLNRYVGRPLARAAATENMPGEKVGLLNRIFGYAYQIRVVGKRLKEWNRTTYYVVKWALLCSLVGLIFLRWW
jgi:beta-hydroxylase